MTPLRRTGLVVVGEEVAHGGEGVAGAGRDVEDHGVTDRETGGERFGWGGHQPLEGRLPPGDEPVRGLLADHLAAQLRIGPRLGQGPLGVDDMLRRLHDDRTGDVEPGPSRPAGDLVELPCRKCPDPLPVVLRQCREHHRADRNVDPDAERVGAADHLEEPGLGETLHQPAVLGQHPGVVDTDAVTDEAREGPAEASREAEPADELGDPVLLGSGAHVDAHERLGPLDRRRLREVDDVDRRLSRGQQVLDGLLQRGQAVGVGQGDGTGPRAHHGRRPAGPSGQVDLEAGDVTQRRRHEDELGPG